ncbi:RidA family protein [Enterococcus faecium]|nr:RidA family protein [Enterococcus faecium]
MKPFSEYRILGDSVHFSGQLPMNSEGEVDNTLSVYEQVIAELRQIEAVATELRVGKNQIVKTNVFITDLEKLSEVNDAYLDFFSEIRPARSAFGVTSLVGNVTVEIDAIIELKEVKEEL